MLTINDFVEEYKTYTDEELYSVYRDIDNYNNEAKNALDIVLEKKGGIESLIKRLEEKVIIENEKKRIGKEAAILGLQGVDASFLKNTTTSSILSKADLDEVIEENIAIAEFHFADKKVDSETLMKTLLGAALATLFGGFFTSFQIIYFGATSYLMIIGLALICYGTIKMVTKKSYNNPAVLITSIVAFLLSYVVGYVAFRFFGYLG